jgi:molybdopterin synthase sulfur carrier subunit
MKVIFFAALREQLDCAETKISTTETITVLQAKQLLVSQNPHWESIINNQSLLAAVNQEISEDDDLVRPDDELAFFPPVTGG